VFLLTRLRQSDGKVETEVVFGITNWPCERAGAQALLGLIRGHWGIANGLHRVPDGTLREDAGRIRRAAAPESMALERNLLVFWFHGLGHRSAAAATRSDVCHPEKSLDVLSTPG
jgi:hypothetical protein